MIFISGYAMVKKKNYNISCTLCTKNNAKNLVNSPFIFTVILIGKRCYQSLLG